jgi:flagellar biosynthetic protein FliP
VHGDLAMKMTADLFWTGLLVALPVLATTLLVGLAVMPPTTIALPLKVLMFVLVDGWSLILKALVGSFH